MNTYCLKHFKNKIMRRKFVLDNFKSDISKNDVQYEEKQEILGFRTIIL